MPLNLSGYYYRPTCFWGLYPPYPFLPVLVSFHRPLISRFPLSLSFRYVFWLAYLFFFRIDGLSLGATEKFHILLCIPVFVASLCNIELSVL